MSMNKFILFYHKIDSSFSFTLKRVKTCEDQRNKENQAQLMNSSENESLNQQDLSDENKQVMLVNDIMEKKVGFGWFQKRSLLILSCIDLNDGCEYIIISIVLPLIREEWNNKSLEQNPHQHSDVINQNTFKWLTTIVFIGMFAGSIFTGYFSDRYGRKKVIMVCSLLYSIACFYSLLITEIYEIFIQRFLQGLIFSVTIPLSTTMFTEISPVKYRGMGVMFINFGITVGLLFGILLSWIILEDINHGKWRLLTAAQFIQGLVVFVGTYLYLLESPRYLMLSNQVQEGVNVLNQMICINKQIVQGDRASQQDNKNLSQALVIQNENLITDQQQIQLINLAKNINHDAGENLNMFAFLKKIESLFNEKNKRLSIFLSLQYLFTGFIAFGQIITIPIIFQEQSKKSFLSLFVSFLGEIPSYLIFYFIFNREGATRKKSMIISWFVSATFNILFYLRIYMSFSLFIVRMSQRCCYILQYLYCNEAYSTHLRTTGLGLMNMTARIGLIIMPFIVLEIVAYSPISSFLLFGLLCYLISFFCYMLPFDTAKMRLDEQSLLVQQDKNENKI
ncbi:MFS transporter (macronuclear) [Tetrahymena thermophila SB210]|uniref:MFS transporter n=1 Tax=Tetrahymena thermophila (strain SB210) TaxID=312017 RepID=I7M3R5_TETTS|nr:MFS transporter [Tetrahymena thermophila SB210]EAS03953.2 MFS transporter [Tetrahymena thermophila SB210]|eukprot:XP_001024198.2 MFS transporter [Tetrahymena thermophila SB210]